MIKNCPYCNCIIPNEHFLTKNGKQCIGCDLDYHRKQDEINSAFDLNCTLMKMCEKLNIPLWKAMQIARHTLK